MNALLISGTDTDAGKTVLTTALVAYWRKYCAMRSLGVMKPIQSGLGDCEQYSQLFNLDPNEVTPLRFEAPLAPPIAAEKEGRRVDMEKIWQAFEVQRQKYDWVLVEALGGLGSPVTYETTVADLAWDWRLPVVLVVPVRLGAIAQAVANVALARISRIHLKGIVLNCPQPCSSQDIDNWAPTKLIQSLTSVPVLGLIPYMTDLTDLDKLAHAASNLELERMIPLRFC